MAQYFLIFFISWDRLWSISTLFTYVLSVHWRRPFVASRSSNSGETSFLVGEIKYDARDFIIAVGRFVCLRENRFQFNGWYCIIMRQLKTKEWTHRCIEPDVAWLAAWRRRNFYAEEICRWTPSPTSSPALAFDFCSNQGKISADERFQLVTVSSDLLILRWELSWRFSCSTIFLFIKTGVLECIYVLT
jgi:hypothetical protein